MVAIGRGHNREGVGVRDGRLGGGGACDDDVEEEGGTTDDDLRSERGTSERAEEGARNERPTTAIRCHFTG